MTKNAFNIFGGGLNLLPLPPGTIEQPGPNALHAGREANLRHKNPISGPLSSGFYF